MDTDGLVGNEQAAAMSGGKPEIRTREAYQENNAYAQAVGGAPPYPPQQDAPPYPPQQGAPPYPPQQGAPPYPPQQGAPPYPPQQGAPPYPPQQGAPPYPPQQGATPYPPQQGAGAKPGFATQVGPAPPGAPVAAGEHDAEVPAPAPDSMDQHVGYGNIGFEGAALPPPTYDDAVREPPPERQTVNSIAAISEQEARDAIVQHVSEHCCYGKSPAAEMQFTDMKSTNAFHYTLETFGEGRSTKWVSKPYMGEGIVVSGPPPGPWDIQLQAPQMFATSVVEVEVPNTASVKPCYNCHARGYKRCSFCFGIGRRMCTTCSGSGMETYYDNGQRNTRRCTWCMGGYSSCTYCGGTGQVMCSKCQGRGNLRWFILLTVQWTNHLDDHIVERTALPDELIRSVRGQTAFEETNPRVWPVNHFPEQEINAASNNLVSRHAGQFTAERILMQRHRVRIIPVTEVFYNYKKQQNATFFVYGEEHKVHAPDYPAKCCWGCTVL